MEMSARKSPIAQQLVLMGGDAIAAMAIVLLMTHAFAGAAPDRCSALCAQGFVPVLLLSSYLCRAYHIRPWLLRTVITRSVVAGGLSFAVLALLDKAAAPPVRLMFGVASFAALQILWHCLVDAVRRSPLYRKNVLILGTGPTAREVERLIEGSPEKYELLGYIGTTTEPVSVEQKKIIGNMEEIVPLCRQHRANLIVMALTERRGLALNKLISCKLMGVPIVDFPNFYEATTRKIPVESINPSWLVQSNGFLITPLIRFLKRIFDIALSSLTLFVTLPLFLLLMILVKCGSRGPVIYCQKRVGKDGKEFTIYKFRTMVTDAEATGEAIWAKVHDPRVTRVGYLLRKFRLDELPQLWNVLSGEMSFIGPRPERPEFVEKICQVTPYYMERHAVKPGITGWAQVMYPYGASLGDSVEKLRYDLYYINNLSVSLEFVIILKTIRVVLFGRGGR